MTKIISIENVVVEYKTPIDDKNLKISIINSVGGYMRKQNNNFFVKALDEVSLSINKGQKVALIGHNGSGKSTLLRVMAGILPPTSGHLNIDGKITPLLNQSLGLESEDSGFDNIVNIGLMLGLTKDEIEKKSNEIASFSELGDYLNLAVRTYSSGMVSRLCFSIITIINPGVLLLDEGIGAADAAFQEKAAKRLNNLFERSETLVLASHSDQLVKSWCNEGYLLKQGKIIYFGTINKTMKEYTRLRNLGT